MTTIRGTASPWLATGLAFVVAVSCGGSYQPRTSRHIYYDGSQTYRRDGADFHIGPLGGGAEALVGNDPRALEHVRRQQHVATRGLLLYLLGLGTMIGSSAAGEAFSSSASTQDTAFWVVFGTGVLVTAFSFRDFMEAQAALHDAINVYNDDVDAPPGRGGP